MTKTRMALALGTALALFGCGGGGGDAESKARVPLSTANYDDVASAVVDSVSGTGPIFDAFDFVVEDTGPTEPTRSPYAALGTGQMGPIAAFALRQLRAGPQAREAALAVETETVRCASGSLQVTVNDADNNDEVSAGDSVTLLASQCVFETGQPAVNGSLSLRVNSIQFDRYGEVSSAGVGLNFTQFSIGDLTLNGAATVSASGGDVTLAYRHLTARVDDQSLVYNYTLTVRQGSLAVNGSLSLNDSTYRLSTLQPISMGRVYPNGGQLKITDGHGAYVLSNFQPSGYVNRLFLAGDDLVDATGPLHPW